MQPGEIGRVTKVIDGDALVLHTGQSVRLVSILAPALNARDQAPELYSGESARLLEDMALGREVQLFYPGLTRDRYDRALAHVVTIDGAGPRLWLNREMVARGGARVRLYPSTAARGRELLALEAEARAAEQGLWRLAPYRVRHDLTQSPPRGFVLFEAVLEARIASGPGAATWLACSWRLAEVDFVLQVRKAAQSACGFSAGTKIHARGWAQDGTLELTHPWHIAVAPAD